MSKNKMFKLDLFCHFYILAFIAKSQIFAEDSNEKQ